MAQTTADDRLKIKADKDLIERIERLSGQDIASCYQCGECTAGCPVAYAADVCPNQVTRLLQIGQGGDALRSRMIWLCVGCETCATRCPRKVELSKVMDALRQVASEEGIAAGEPAIKTFHETFLRSVERMGRTHEISMLGEYKMRSLQLFSDLILGARMFLRGKLALLPKMIKGRGEIKNIFRRTRQKD